MLLRCANNQEREPPLQGAMTMITVSKPCTSCKVDKPFSEYYIRSGVNNPTEPGHYNSECKACMLERSKRIQKLPATMPRAFTEKLAIEYLTSQGIGCLPGKAVKAAHVDIAAWGHVWIEVKYARLQRHRGAKMFKFNSTPSQKRRGFLAHIVLLICEYPDERRTFHLFPADHPVFEIDGRTKTGFTFRPGATHALKHGNNRVVMTQPIMDEAQDRIDLIWKTLLELSENFKKQA